ncbi:NAD-dependent epimerase/dehydratase family protein [Actinomycetospora sp. OC33-EN08]|uniref:NAD-dependent epimerase/dehydratase family protein n=1 Tax=Actinomycetospora aurantiaca TaxID=3129233 RepID=A0ABU8MQD7_9PSEU
MLIVVTGATGKTGRRIVPRLRAAGTQVRAVGRTSEPRHDWADRTTWPAVLAPDAAGLTALFAELFDGRNARPTDGVARALGRAPRSFSAALADAFPTAGAR